MTPLERALIALARRLSEINVSYMLVGGMANAIWGEPRATLDIDVTRMRTLSDWCRPWQDGVNGTTPSSCPDLSRLTIRPCGRWPVRHPPCDSALLACRPKPGGEQRDLRQECALKGFAGMRT